jgi:Tol biopolymer transport system component
MVYFGGSFYETEADGTVEIGSVAAGDYEVAAEHPDFLYFSATVRIPSGEYMLPIQLEASTPEFKVARVSPGLGEASPDQSGTFTIQFTRPVDESSFLDSDVSFEPALGDFSISVEGATAVVQFESEWPLRQTVRWKLLRAIESTAGEELAGNYVGQFRVPAQDRTPPRLSSSRPRNGETGVFRNQQIVLVFSDDILPSSLATAAIGISPEISLEKSLNGKRLELRHESLFAANRTYNFNLDGLTDLSGNPLAEPVGIEFTTSDQVRRVRYRNPDWTRVGDKIVFESDEAGGFDIWEIRADGSGLTKLTSGTGDELHPRYSYDGRSIVFERNIDGFWHVFRLEIESGEEFQVTAGSDNYRSPVYSPTFERKIAFVSDRTDVVELWVSEEDGSVPREWLPRFGRGPSDPDFHPFVDSLILFSADGGVSRDIFRASGRPGDPDAFATNLTDELASDETAPAYSPEGDRICFVSTAGGGKNVWIADAGGEFPRQLTSQPRDVDHPVFAPTVGEPRILAELYQEDGTIALAFFDSVSGELLGYLLGGSEP